MECSHLSSGSTSDLELLCNAHLRPFIHYGRVLSFSNGEARRIVHFARQCGNLNRRLCTIRQGTGKRRHDYSKFLLHTKSEIGLSIHKDAVWVYLTLHSRPAVIMGEGHSTMAH